MDPSKTLWIGNLEPGTDEKFIRKIFEQLSKEITIKQYRVEFVRYKNII
jgi:RNA recognition motif-containing protein